MRLHSFAAGIGLALALAGCASSGGLHTNGTPTDPSTLATAQSLAPTLSSACLRSVASAATGPMSSVQ